MRAHDMSVQSQCEFMKVILQSLCVSVNTCTLRIPGNFTIKMNITLFFKGFCSPSSDILFVATKKLKRTQHWSRKPTGSNSFQSGPNLLENHISRHSSASFVRRDVTMSASPPCRLCQKRRGDVWADE